MLPPLPRRWEERADDIPAACWLPESLALVSHPDRGIKQSQHLGWEICPAGTLTPGQPFLQNFVVEPGGAPEGNLLGQPEPLHLG